MGKPLYYVFISQSLHRIHSPYILAASSLINLSAGAGVGWEVGAIFLVFRRWCLGRRKAGVESPGGFLSLQPDVVHRSRKIGGKQFFISNRLCGSGSALWDNSWIWIQEVTNLRKCTKKEKKDRKYSYVLFHQIKYSKYLILPEVIKLNLNIQRPRLRTGVL